MYKIGIVLSLAIITTVMPVVNAQSPKPLQPRPATKQSETHGKTVFKRETTKAIDKNIALPDVPLYPGAKFLSGEQAEPSERVICACTINYVLPNNNSQSQVIDFYANALNSNGWRMEQQTKNIVTASNQTNHSHCDIIVDYGDQKTTRLHINYVCTPKMNYRGGN